MRLRTLLPAFIAIVIASATALGEPKKPAPPPPAPSFLIVVNAHNDVPSLTRSELKRLCTGGLKQWPNDVVVQLGIIPEDSPETNALAGLLELSLRELLTRIQEQIFKGEMRRPAVLHSSADCISFATAIPGAICVAQAQDLPDGVRSVPLR